MGASPYLPDWWTTVLMNKKSPGGFILVYSRVWHKVLNDIILTEPCILLAVVCLLIRTSLCTCCFLKRRVHNVLMTACIHELDERAVVRWTGLYLTHEYLYRCVTDYRELLYLMMMMMLYLMICVHMTLCLCLCMSVCMCVYIHVRMHHIHIYICLCVCVYTYMCACITYTYIYVCVYVCIHTCVHASHTHNIYVCVCVCICRPRADSWVSTQPEGCRAWTNRGIQECQTLQYCFVIFTNYWYQYVWHITPHITQITSLFIKCITSSGQCLSQSTYYDEEGKRSHL